MEQPDVQRLIDEALRRLVDQLGSLGWLDAVDLTRVAQANFSAYSPTVTSGIGAITTLGAVTGRSCKVGKLVFFELTIPITTNGTGATDIEATLPFTAAAFVYMVSGRANAVSLKQLQGRIPVSGTKVFITNYDNTYPGADGETLVVSGFYESAN